MSIFRAANTLALATILALTTAPAFSYSISKNKIVDDKGKVVQLRGVNVSGFESASHVMDGLWVRNWKEMINQMQGFGFNAVRLPFCPATLRSDTMPSSIDYSRNADLQGLTSLQVLDKVINEFNARGMYVLLDHHTPDCASISELWYTGTYSQAQWLNDLRFVANRYKNVPSVIGVDLKNEPHGAATWGTGNADTDWNKAAERGAAAVLAVAPKWIIAVEGITDNPVCSTNGGIFWGGSLQPLACTPLNIPANRLLLAPHAYGPDVYVQSYFNDSNFPNNMPAIWDRHFGQFAGNHALLLGEFGGKYGEGDARDKVWQDALVKYLRSKGINQGFYWPWGPNSVDTGGILRDDWTTVRKDKMTLLRTLWGTKPTPTPTPTP
ncbi:endoglucanase, partial [Xanthomonas oryzae pv. oryzae]